jgi:hypothetical protein
MSMALQHATASLPPAQWTPITGSGTHRAVPSGGWQPTPPPSWGSRALPPPSQPPRPHDPISNLSTVSASSGQVHKQAPARRSRKGLWLGLAGLAMLGGAITIAVVMSDSPSEPETVAADQPAPPPDETAKPATPEVKPAEPAKPAHAAADDDDGPDIAAQIEDATKQLPAGIRKQVKDAIPDVKRVEQTVKDTRKAATASAGVTAIVEAPPIPPAPGAWIEERTLAFPGWNPRRVEVGAFIKFALAQAKQAMPDAQLTRIGITGVTPDGYANLELPTLASSHGDIELRFISPSHSKPDPGTPAGLPVKLACEFRIEGSPDGVEIRPMFKTSCKERAVSPPRCTAAGLWKLALANRAPGNAVANLNYYQASMHDKPRWFFDVGFGHDVIYSKVFYNADCP